MSIWNKILVGLILLLSVIFFFMAARALNAHRHWQQQARVLKQKLLEQEAVHRELMEGSPEDPSMLGLLPTTKLELGKLLVDRGRVWHDCRPQRVSVVKDPQTGEDSVEVAVTTDSPDPHGIDVKTVLFIFEQKKIEDGGAYLGQFTVTAAPPKNLQLQPSRKLTVREFQRLEASQKNQTPWVLYEVMPADRHDVLTELSEDEIRSMFPDDTEDEYVKDGRPSDPTNPESAKYVRQLRDYDVLFGAYHNERSMAIDERQAATRDLKYLQAALADAKQQEQFRIAEIDGLKKELAECVAERDAVAAHRKALEAKLSAVNADIERMIEANQALAGEIARIQLEATRRIDEQTRRMAQAGGVR